MEICLQIAFCFNLECMLLKTFIKKYLNICSDFYKQIQNNKITIDDVPEKLNIIGGGIISDKSARISVFIDVYNVIV